MNIINKMVVIVLSLVWFVIFCLVVLNVSYYYGCKSSKKDCTETVEPLVSDCSNDACSETNPEMKS